MRCTNMPVVSEPERSLERRIPQVAHYRVTDESAAPFFFFFSQIIVRKKQLTLTVLSGGRKKMLPGYCALKC